MAERHCLALDLVDDADLIARYEAFHEPGGVWPEIVESIRSSGILSMEIYRAHDRMFMIMEVSEDFDPAAKAVSDQSNPKIAEWEALMDQFQQRLSFAAEGEKWVPMTRIFDLADQP